jgi:hypothetical protein
MKDETINDIVFDYLADIQQPEDIPIRIMPTTYEIQEGILIPGHRMLPFHPTAAPSFILSIKTRMTLLCPLWLK